MPYRYETEKIGLFTDEGQRAFLHIRDQTKSLLEKAGAVTMGKATLGVSGSDWTNMACVDRMVELGELVEIQQQCGRVAGQDRIFVARRKG